jgi:hypothetical protein
MCYNQLLGKNKKYEIPNVKRLRNGYEPKLLLTIQYSEDVTMDIFLSWRYSDLFTVEIIDNMNSSSVRAYLVFKEINESLESFVLGFE